MPISQEARTKTCKRGWSKLPDKMPLPSGSGRIIFLSARNGNQRSAEGRS